jgi:selenocysteine lyase/cysteine desulfurase
MVEIRDAPASARVEEAFSAFVDAYPAFGETRIVDELRRSEFSRLDAQGHVYLDYTGGGLYSESQVHSHADFLLGNILGNPHSRNPSSRGTTDSVERCRQRILSFFRASPEEYEVVFTANASHALKLVGESYPFEPGDRFLLTFDNHNSVNGIREFDRTHGAETTYVPVMPPDMLVEDETVLRYLDLDCSGRHKLFAYPAQSNFSGVHHPLEWIEQAQTRGWDVLLDAAAFVPTNRLDLSLWHPDYVALSFYKMFGYPTGVGSLIARREALEKLHRPWFAGGTIEVASVQADRFYMAAGAAAFEDGTLDYSNIPAVENGLDFLDSIGLEIIHTRVQCLAGWMIDNLIELRYGNGARLIRLYGPSSIDRRGGTLALNFCTPSGEIIDQEMREPGQQAPDLPAHGLFLQPRGGRGRSRPLSQRAHLLLPRLSRAHELRRLPQLHPRWQRCGASLGRAGE